MENQNDTNEMNNGMKWLLPLLLLGLLGVGLWYWLKGSNNTAVKLDNTPVSIDTSISNAADNAANAISINNDSLQKNTTTSDSSKKSVK
jgi:hypothetical protein